MAMNLPNKLTLARVIMIPLMMVFLLINHDWSRNIACIVFIIASLTDMLDGHLARKNNQITNFGKIMDPLADKLLVTAAIVILVQLGDLPAWIVVIILAREFAVTGLRSVAASEGIVIAAGIWGKWKTTFQMIALVFLIAKPLTLAIFHFNIGMLFIYIALILTIYSGCDYFIKIGKKISWS